MPCIFKKSESECRKTEQTMLLFADITKPLKFLAFFMGVAGTGNYWYRKSKTN